MEQSAGGPGDGDSEGDVASPRLSLTIEQHLDLAMGSQRMASGDAMLWSIACSKVLTRLRAVAPDLVAAAEEECGVHGPPYVI